MSDPVFPIIMRQIIATIGTVALFSLLSLLIMLLFRIKNPSLRYLLLVLPLIKGLLVLTRKPFSFTGQQKGKLIIGFKLSDPLSFIPDKSVLDVYQAPFIRHNIDWYFWPTMLLVITVLTFLSWRGYQLWRFYKFVSLAPEIDKRKYPIIADLLDGLVKQTLTSRPKLVIAKTSAAPFTVGLVRPIIVLSPTLLETLSPSEVKSVLAHEVAHITRRDYLYHWFIIALRDVMYFNPLTHLIYYLLNFEKERACDYLATFFTKEPLSLAESLVKVAELRRAEPVLGFTRSLAPQSLLREKNSRFFRRVKDLIEPPRLKPFGYGRKILLLLGVIFFLLLNIYIGVLFVDPVFFIAY